MYKYAVFAVLLLCVCLCYVSAAPGSFNDLLDAQTAIQKIIAAYEALPGSSKHHPSQVATVVDPNHFQVPF